MTVHTVSDGSSVDDRPRQSHRAWTISSAAKALGDGDVKHMPDNDPLAYQTQKHRSNLSLGILTHLKTVFPAEDAIENLVRSLTSGWDSSVFQDVFVFYDTKGLPDNFGIAKNTASTPDDNVMLSKWFRFSKKMQQLHSQGLVSKHLPLKRNSSVPAAMGSKDDAVEDSAMYAIYQLLMEECQTQYCAFLTQDIMAHGGGGLQHAMYALEEDDSLVFAVPPLASQGPNWNEKNDMQMRELFMRFDETKPYNTNLGVINQTQAKVNVTCTAKGTQLSTRYFVASRDRFAKNVPFTPVPEKDAWFEIHEGARKFTASTECPLGTGYLIHPPPWHHGTQLFESCGNISTLQQAVDNPNYYVVDGYNNMIMENWTAACHSISNLTQVEPEFS